MTCTMKGILRQVLPPLAWALVLISGGVLIALGSAALRIPPLAVFYITLAWALAWTAIMIMSEREGRRP